MCLALYCLGSVFQEAGDVRKAIELYRESLSILECILPVHFLTADGILAGVYADSACSSLWYYDVVVLDRLAGCLFQLGEITECLQLFLRLRNVLSTISPVSEKMAIGKCHYNIVLTVKIISSGCHFYVCIWNSHRQWCLINYYERERGWI